MRRLFALIVFLLMLPGTGMVMSAEEKKNDQKKEQQTDQKKDKKDNDKDKKGEEPVLIVVYEYAWPPKMR